VKPWRISAIVLIIMADTPKKGSSGRKTVRDKAVRVKTARGRKNSSTRWLQRQLNDPYVREAQRLGYKSRAAFKLKELDEQLGLIKPNTVAVDLGAAPGGWCQVLNEHKADHIVAIDLIEVTDIPNINFIQMDFTDDDAPQKLIDMLDGKRPNLVLSDMAPNTVGHPKTDHLRTMALVEMAWDFAYNTLEEGGHFVSKVFQGGTGKELLDQMKPHFDKIKHVKPKSSRKGSPENFLIAMGFKKNRT
jgi:23S rRNA (uridine2552-2'-O)-methyltransferase